MLKFQFKNDCYFTSPPAVGLFLRAFLSLAVLGSSVCKIEITIGLSLEQWVGFTARHRGLLSIAVAGKKMANFKAVREE